MTANTDIDALLREYRPTMTLEIVHAWAAEAATALRTAQEEARSREALAKWMMQNSFATGHGDTIEDLIGELDWQLKRERATAQEENARMREALTTARGIVTEEFNYSNYDHQTVCRIGAMWDEALSVITAALPSPPETSK